MIFTTDGALLERFSTLKEAFAYLREQDKDEDPTYQVWGLKLQVAA